MLQGLSHADHVLDDVNVGLHCHDFVTGRAHPVTFGVTFSRARHQIEAFALHFLQELSAPSYEAYSRAPLCVLQGNAATYSAEKLVSPGIFIIEGVGTCLVEPRTTTLSSPFGTTEARPLSALRLSRSIKESKVTNEKPSFACKDVDMGARAMGWRAVRNYSGLCGVTRNGH